MTDVTIVAGRFRLLRRLASGGMGVVWHASDEEQDGRGVALKQVRLVDDSDPNERSRLIDALRRESQLAATAGEHPHVVAVHGVVEHDSEPWLVMDLVDGRDLRRVVREDGALPAPRAAALGVQLAEAVEHLHTRGLVHGDITPGNVLVTPDDQVVLTDFGISRPLHATTLTTVGRPRGVPAFLAPEVAAGQVAGSTADVFGLGAVMFYAVRGQGPWGDDDERVVLGRALSGGAVPLRRDDPFQRLLAPMLRRRPRERPPVAVCRDALERFRDGRRLPRSVAWRRRRTRALAAVAAVVVVGAVALVGVSLAGPHTPDPVLALAGSLADQRALDPCGLVDDAVLRRFGSTSVIPDYGNFDRCDVFIDDAGRSVQLTALVETAGDPPPPGTTSTVEDGFQVLRLPAPADSCTRRVVLPGGQDLQIQVGIEGGLDPAVCSMADVGTSSAVSVLSSGTLPRRSLPFPAGSLGTVDACGLLTGDDVARATGTAPAPAPPVEPGFGRWRCHWATAGGGPGILVRFDRDTKGPAAIKGRPTTVPGRVAAEATGEPGECTVSMRQRPYPRPEGEVSQEVVLVQVANSRDPDPCRVPRALALPVAERLPHPS